MIKNIGIIELIDLFLEIGSGIDFDPLGLCNIYFTHPKNRCNNK